MYPKLLSVINVVQSQSVLCPAITGLAGLILHGLQPGIVGLGRGRRLLEGDMRRSCHRPP